MLEIASFDVLKLVKCGMLTQNDMTITAMKSKSNPKKMTD